MVPSPHITIATLILGHGIKPPHHHSNTCPILQSPVCVWRNCSSTTAPSSTVRAMSYTTVKSHHIAKAVPVIHHSIKQPHHQQQWVTPTIYTQACGYVCTYPPVPSTHGSSQHTVTARHHREQIITALTAWGRKQQEWKQSMFPLQQVETNRIQQHQYCCFQGNLQNTPERAEHVRAFFKHNGNILGWN